MFITLSLSPFPYYVQTQDLKFLLIITGMFGKTQYFQFNDINLFPTSTLKFLQHTLQGLQTCFVSWKLTTETFYSLEYEKERMKE